MSDVTDQGAGEGGGRRARGEGRGAAARRASRTGGGPGPSLPYIQRKIREYEVLDEEGLQLIERNAEGSEWRRRRSLALEAMQLSVLAQGTIQIVQRYYIAIALLIQAASGIM